MRGLKKNIIFENQNIIRFENFNFLDFYIFFLYFLDLHFLWLQRIELVEDIREPNLQRHSFASLCEVLEAEMKKKINNQCINIGSWLDATEWHIYFFSHEKSLEICVKDTVG